MSAESVVIYYGLKFPVNEEEIEQLEQERHSYQVAAKNFGLDCYWGNFSAYEDEYYVFIGKEIGIVGYEHEWNQEIADSELSKFIELTKEALRKAGFTDEPKLLLHLEPDL